MWYPDTGEDSHATGVEEKFHELDKLVKGKVRFEMTQILQSLGEVLSCLRTEMVSIESYQMCTYFIPSPKPKSNIIRIGQLSERGFVMVRRKCYRNCHKLITSKFVMLVLAQTPKADFVGHCATSTFLVFSEQVNFLQQHIGRDIQILTPPLVSGGVHQDVHYAARLSTHDYRP